MIVEVLVKLRNAESSSLAAATSIDYCSIVIVLQETYFSPTTKHRTLCFPGVLLTRYDLDAARFKHDSPANTDAVLQVTSQALRARSNPLLSSRFAVLQKSFLSTETRTAIEKAVASAPVVLFMKGTPETPQCGFSRASIQILGLQGVNPQKFTAFNVLEDEELRAGIKEFSEWPTIPQLYVNKEFVGGTDIMMSMHQDGSLAKLLEEKDVLVAADASDASSSSP
nr:monothiol glutaredoxin-5, mitochondrial [Quercus suber]